MIVKALRKSFGDTVVLAGVDLDLPSGELTALLGRSGSGKTTLLRIVAGFDRPDAGTVVIGGRPVTALAPEKRRLGYVTQDGNLFPHLTVAGNITFGLPWRQRRARHRVGELLELVGLDARYAGRRPHSLSGGEQQRVALARALAPGPDLLLLDEPFSALDAELRGSTRRAVAATLRATGTTALLVTHDQAEAMSLAARVAVLRDGVIRQEGTPRDLYLRPVDRDIAGFVGDLATVPATFDGGTAQTPIGPVELRTAAEHGAGEVLLRPEQIELTDDGATALVTAVEFHGSSGIAHVISGDCAVTVRCPAHLLPAPGAEVKLRVRGTALLVAS
ncbi:iron(III) transport system ATP-binding protein [Asanoa ferruginea]|uniref:ABC-type quaternary amine transporter n=1 Tax=Asanoa ferruginea TaxID=53367 RepID=A0A3D9ZTD7_9ACTN|nr:ABC transporter ATP-binding protein [Asanoa ferruginea]REF99253.1 iron(III) transport system ATP-binding protein [Asanoa ferruginea]GIF45851.1 ABC transporter [Asanoa ferruginea]